jgi:hypothetical protein
MNTPRNVLHAALRTDLSMFIEKTFNELVPGQEYLPNWHVNAIAYQLERCFRREVKRQIILLPPRYLKSISISDAFPAWGLGQDPRLRFSRLGVRNFVGISFSRQLMPDFIWRRAKNLRREAVCPSK